VSEFVDEVKIRCSDYCHWLVTRGQLAAYLLQR